MKAHRAAVIGAGHTRFGALPDGPRALLRAAVGGALSSVDRGIDPAAIGAAYLATLGFGGWQIGNSSAILAEEAGAPGIPWPGSRTRAPRAGSPSRRRSARSNPVRWTSPWCRAREDDRRLERPPPLLAGRLRRHGVGANGRAHLRGGLRADRLPVPRPPPRRTGGARGGRREEPRERTVEPERPLPEGDHSGSGPRVAARGRSPRPLRLLPGERRGVSAPARPRGRRPEVHGYPRLHRRDGCGIRLSGGPRAVGCRPGSRRPGAAGRGLSLGGVRAIGAVVPRTARLLHDRRAARARGPGVRRPRGRGGDDALGRDARGTDPCP